MLKTIYSAGAWLALGCLIAGTSQGSAIAEDRFAPCADAALPGLAGSVCATSSMPLRSDKPDAGAIELFIRKFPSTGPTTTGQVWLIAGGPGESGASFDVPLSFHPAATRVLGLVTPRSVG